MPMELIKPCMITIFLLFLLLLAEPCFSTGGMEVGKMESAIYDIDYRGPETHSYRPPPNRSGGRGNTNNVHQKRVVAHRGSKRLRSGNAATNGKKLHG